MASYTVPQVEIHQLFKEIPISVTQNQVAFVFGPNYILHRYGDAELVPTAYSNTQTPIELDTIKALDPEKIDEKSVRLFMDNAVVKLSALKSVSAIDEFTLTVELGDTPVDDLFEGRKLYIKPSTGDAVVVDITKVEPESTGPVKVTIDEALEIEPKAIAEIVVCEIQDGTEIPRKDLTDAGQAEFNWTFAAAKNGTPAVVTLEAGLKTAIQDANATATTGEVISADVYVQFRELTTAYSDTIHAITGGAAEVSSVLGTIHPDNPLAQAVYNAALNAGGQVVRYMATPTNDADGYSAVLRAAELTREVYFLVPTTRDTAILDLVKSHVEKMSDPRAKHWRIAFISAEVPEFDPIYTATATNNNIPFEAIVSAVDDEAGTADITFVKNDAPSTDTEFKKYVKPDDIFVTDLTKKAWGEPSPRKYRVKVVLSNNKLRVYNTDIDPITKLTQQKLTVSADSDPGTPAEVYHQFTAAQQAEQIRNISSDFGSRRMYNVYPSNFTGGGVTQSGEFAAACVAGLVSACLPQQPVTNMQLTGIDDIPLVYQTYSYDELNTIASGGTFIVMQDLPNDQVYVRHQISTAYEDNNLNTAELSITKNLDSISFALDDLLSPYIGKYNITPDLLAVLSNAISSFLVNLGNNSYGLYGSQIILEGTRIVKLEQDTLLKDHVNCDLELNLPYPFNTLVLKLYI